MNQWLINNLVAFGLAFLLTGILIPQILVIAFRKRLFDGHGERKVHRGEVPRLGGIAFVPAVIFSTLATIGFGLKGANAFLTHDLAGAIVPLLFLICALMLLFLVGIADDLIGVRYSAKFFFQLLAAVLLITAGVWIDNFYGLFFITGMSPWAGWLITGLAVVYIVNSINLIDGIDGLAAGLSAVGLLFYGMLFFLVGGYIYSMVAFAAFGSLLPFLYFNVFGKAVSRKKIFMGDTGSLTIGLILVFLAIQVTRCPSLSVTGLRVNPMVVAISPLLIPMFDVARVFYRRLRRHRNPFMPDRSHIHHKLLAVGLTPTAALASILTVALMMLAANVWLSIYLHINLLILFDLAFWILANMWLTHAIRRREKKQGTRLYD